MYKLTVSTLALALLAGCQEYAPAATAAEPVRDHRMQPDGTCKATLIHDSLIERYVPYGSYCPVPESLRTPHADGSLPADRYGAGVAYSTWTTNDGNCEPRAWAIDNVVNVSMCLKPHVVAANRWMFDSAYKMPAVLTWGM